MKCDKIGTMINASAVIGYAVESGNVWRAKIQSKMVSPYTEIAKSIMGELISECISVSGVSNDMLLLPALNNSCPAAMRIPTVIANSAPLLFMSKTLTPER